MKVFWVVLFLCISLCNIQAVVISDPNNPLSQLQQEEISDLYEILLAVYDNDITLVPDEPNEILALETSEDSTDLLAWEIIKMIRGVWDPNSEYFDDTSSVAFEEQCISNESLGSASNTPAEFSNDQSSVNITETCGQTLQFMEPVEDLSNPLGSRILESKTYRITTLPLEIEGHVVIPAGAKLIAPYDPNSNIIEVLPGGLLDMGKAVNISDPNFPEILPQVELLPEDPNYYFTHNNVGIYIRRGANCNTRIYNTLVSHCRIGIVADEALTNPIQNVITYGCYDGIYVFAPNSILDSEFWLYGMIGEGFYGYIGAGIYINTDGQDNTYPAVKIDRTVTYGGDVGIFLESHDLDPNATDPNQTVGSLKVINSIMFCSYYCGIYITEGQTNINLEYCAFGDNYYNSNIELPFTGCVGLSYDPFYTLGEDKRLFIAPWSEVVDAGYGMAEDGRGTCDNRPDIGPMDIGCHFPVGVRGSFGIPSSSADFNWDGIVDELDMDVMDWCMGATGEPNIVMFDTSFGSQIDIPDLMLFVDDYGYSNDANLPGNHDPNCERSDYNGDHQVNLEDWAILAEHWLTKVFDPYRVCSLCNLYQNPDPNEPVYDDIIDSKDYDTFMAEWGKQFFSEPNILIVQSASKLTVAVGTPEPAWKISAFLDDELIAQYATGELGSPVFDVDLTRYGPGSHKVRIVRNIGYGLEINERIVLDPNSTGLYFADTPETFEPNELYFIRGFNLNEGDLNFKIINPGEEIVYDVNAPSGTVDLSIPTSVLVSNPITTMSIQAVGENAVTEKDLIKEFKREEYDGKTVQMVIIAPDKDVYKYRKSSIMACAQACNNQNVNWVLLYYTDVTPGNLTYLLHRQTVRYVYWCGHGNSHVGRTEEQEELNQGGEPRTHMSCWKHIARNWWPDKWEKLLALSWTRQNSSNSPVLPDNWDQRGFDISTIGMYNTPDKWIVFIDCCRSAIYDVLDESDMARSFGIGNSGNNNQIYIGWRSDITTSLSGDKETFSSRNYDNCVTKINPGIRWFWEKMGTGNTVQKALEATTEASSLGQDTVLALWGLNTQMDLTKPNNNNDDSIRVYGNGLTNKLGNGN